MSIEPKEPCGTCGGKPVLTMCDRDGKTADIIGGWCQQCGRLGPMRAEVQDACAAWDADQARKGEALEGGVVSAGRYSIVVVFDKRIDDLALYQTKVLIVRKGAK